MVNSFETIREFQEKKFDNYYLIFQRDNPENDILDDILNGRTEPQINAKYSASLCHNLGRWLELEIDGKPPNKEAATAFFRKGSLLIHDPYHIFCLTEFGRITKNQDILEKAAHEKKSIFARFILFEQLPTKVNSRRLRLYIQKIMQKKLRQSHFTHADFVRAMTEYTNYYIEKYGFHELVIPDVAFNNSFIFPVFQFDDKVNNYFTIDSLYKFFKAENRHRELFSTFIQPTSQYLNDIFGYNPFEKINPLNSIYKQYVDNFKAKFVDYSQIQIHIPGLLESASSTIYNFKPEHGFTVELARLFDQLQNYWIIANVLKPELVELNRIPCTTYEFFEFTELVDSLRSKIYALKCEIQTQSQLDHDVAVAAIPDDGPDPSHVIRE